MSSLVLAGIETRPIAEARGLQINLQVGKAVTTLQTLLDNSYHDHFDFAFVGKSCALFDDA